MVNNLMDAVKGSSSAKSSQAQKSKKSVSNDKTAFSQALNDAAGAANSANAQPDRQTYEQNDAKASEKGAGNVQAVSENPVQQAVIVPENLEGQNGLMGLAQMGTEGIQAAGAQEAVIGQNMAETVQDTGIAQTQAADMVQATENTGKISLDSVQDLAQADGASVNVEELAPQMQVTDVQADAETAGQNVSSNTGEKSAALANAQEDEGSVIDVRAEAAADKVSTSYIQNQAGNDSGVVEAEVEVTPTGEIKPEYENMLKDMIAKQINSGRQEFEMALTPKNLGTLLVKVAIEAGETTVSIICTNERTMQAMSSKASELGKMLETTLGDKMEVVVEDKNGQESHFYDEGRNDSGAQAQKEEQERRYEDARKSQAREADSADFLQQLRLGLA